jgi:hypothetical protein
MANVIGRKKKHFPKTKFVFDILYCPLTEILNVSDLNQRTKS